MIGENNIGYLQKTKDGFEGQLVIENIDISPIEGMYFLYEKDNTQYLWLKRKPILEYDYEEYKYIQRPREPRWEAYLKKQENDAMPYCGEFVFLHFRFSIKGVWDKTDSGKKKKRLNLFVERLPMEKQNIINTINERNSKDVW